MSLARRQLESWLSTIPVKADSVLDVGGETLPIEKRTHSWEVNDYKILDRRAVRRTPDYLHDLNEPFDLGRKFDVIFCTEVMQFIWNPIVALQNMRKHIVDGGWLYINFQETYPNMKGDDYLRYTSLGAHKLLARSDFTVWDYQQTFTGHFIKAKAR